MTSDGLRTIALPAIRAGPTLRAKIAAGKFHGMIATTTPCGSSRTSSCSRRPAAATTSPTCRYRWANAWSKNALTPPISPRASVIVLPCSATTMRASSSACRSTSLITAPITSARSPRVRLAHDFWAAAAAASTSSTCSCVASGTAVSTSPVAGFSTPRVSSVVTQRSPMRIAGRSPSRVPGPRIDGGAASGPGSGRASVTEVVVSVVVLTGIS